MSTFYSPFSHPFAKPLSRAKNVPLVLLGGQKLTLDIYPGAVAAYSLRKLRSAYLGASIRVRRSSDNAEQDIGFNGIDLDTAAITAFCASANGFVAKWYDQSGNGFDAVQPTTTFQPLIVESGTLTADGKPAIKCVQSNWLHYSSPLPLSNASLFCAYNQTVVENYSVLSTQNLDEYFRFTGDGRAYPTIFTASRVEQFPSAVPASGRILWETFHNGTSMQVYINNVDKGSNSTQAFSPGFWLRVCGGHGRQMTGYSFEVIVFSNNKLADRSAISANINDYWGVY